MHTHLVTGGKALFKQCAGADPGTSLAQPKPASYLYRYRNKKYLAKKEMILAQSDRPSFIHKGQTRL